MNDRIKNALQSVDTIKELPPLPDAIGDQYRKRLTAIAEQLFNREITQEDFVRLGTELINEFFPIAWGEGLGVFGVSNKEMTVKEYNTLTEAITQEVSRLTSFAKFIFFENGLGRIYDRIDMWVTSLFSVRSKSQQMSRDDAKLRWVYNPDKEHCDDCLNLNGRVYRASVWRKYNIRPKSRSLKCGGWRCGCEFVPTRARVTPGKPPPLIGPN